MAVPDFQTLMLPALTLLAKSSPRSTNDVREALAAQFNLTPEDLAIMLPSGTQTTFTNRVAWAYSYMKQAGLISSPKRGVYEITDRGRGTLASNVPRIDIEFLTQFPEFQAFRQASAVQPIKEETSQEVGSANLTPDEQI